MSDATGIPDRLPGFGVDDPLTWTDERRSLQAFLDRQRELVDWKLRGATAATLQAAATPSGMTPLGVVQHLVEVERSWWRDRVLGDPDVPSRSTPDDRDGDWRVPSASTTEQVLDEYANECRRCDAAVQGLSLDQVGVRTRFTVRWVYQHLIEETARHLGHLDLLRESADGVVGEEPG